MNKQILYFALFMALVSVFACDKPAANNNDDTVVVDASYQTTKPWTRWWWHGSSVTHEGITAELEAYQKAGIGGLELTPIYGMKGDEKNFTPYLSSEWVELLEYTLKEAARLGLGVDMATGTGWPFGGPWVDAASACKYVAHKKYTIQEGERLEEKIELIQKPILRTVNNPALKFENIKEPIAENTDLQTLALDQVRFEKPLPLQLLMAYNENGQTIDLTAKVTNGQLDWLAPKGSWNLYAVFQGGHGKMVERAAPGGEGNVIDHFSTAAIEGYLKKFDESFSGKNIGSLRAFFNDSYEVDDAQGQADWTPQLFEAFEAKRGYDLKKHLPELFGDNTIEKNVRVKSDYRETISDLLLETFTLTWAKWAKENKAIIRNQAHGSPSNILDLYAASDIPETEGTDIIKAKMASSAAHVAGRPLVSAEAATWLGEHFTTNLADLKENVDRYFGAGINHIFYHGTCYSPPEEAYPGRLFYAAIHANPRNSLWADYPAFNKYIERTQAYLQTTKPDNDVLLYLPAYDRYATPRKEMMEHFDGWTMGKHDKNKTNVRLAAEWLQEKGYAYDFISDQQINKLKVEGGKIKTQGGSSYQSILIPETAYMPIATLEDLKKLSYAGGSIIFDKKLPTSVPGFFEVEKRTSTFENIKSDLIKKQVIIENDLATAFQKAKVKRESLTDNGLEFHRRSLDNGTIYFISNWSDNNFEGWVDLTASAASVIIYDPMTGKEGTAKTKNDKVYLQLNRGASLLLKIQTSDSEDVAAWNYFPSQNEPIEINGKWKLSFLKGGPTLPASVELDELKMWTDLPEAAYQSFSGTASYQIDFSKPKNKTNGFFLDLGTVNESATVVLNGQELGTCIGPVYQLFIPNDVLKEKNSLEIKVSNSMANRIIALEKNGTRWQKFYNINVSARKRENLGKDRVFTTKDWTPKSSGLAGPVLLIKK